MRYRNLIIFGTASLLLSGCGPSDEESARAVMMATPLVYLAGMGVMALMLFLWRKVEPGLGINWRPVLLGLALACAVGLLSVVGVTNEPPHAEGDPDWQTPITNGIPGVYEWVGFAIVFYGTSYLSLLLVIWRIWLWRRPATAFTWAWAPVLFMMLAPGPLILSSDKDSAAMNFFMEAGFGLWTYPGLVGMVTGPLLLIALIEVWIRHLARKRKRHEDKERIMVEEKWLDEYTGQSTDELIALQGECRADSLVLAFEQALDQKANRIGLDNVTAEEKVVLAIEALEREVNNGGYDQFFMNSSKEHAPIIVDALKRIGCTDTALLTRQAIDTLGIQGHLTVEAIDRVMENESDEREEKLGECDERYYEVAGDLAGPLLEFIKSNKDKITLKE